MSKKVQNHPQFVSRFSALAGRDRSIAPMGVLSSDWHLDTHKNAHKGLCYGPSNGGVAKPKTWVQKTGKVFRANLDALVQGIAGP